VYKKTVAIFVFFLLLILIPMNDIRAEEDASHNIEVFPITINPLVEDYISVDLTEAEPGEIVNITITPPVNQRLTDNGIVVTDVSDITNNTSGSRRVSFVMPENGVEINASFEEIIFYNISVYSEIENYVIVSPNEAEEGQTINIRIAPPEGYRLMENGVTAINISDFIGNAVASMLVSFIMPSGNIEINATFEPIPIYTIYIEHTVENHLTVDPISAQAGETITVLITPPTGHRLIENGITATGVTAFEGNVTGSTSVTFLIGDWDVTINAEFELIPVYDITIDPNLTEYLRVNLSSSEEGHTIIVTITPPEGQRLAENGIEATGVTDFNGNIAGSTMVLFSKTSGNTEIRAKFEQIPIYSVTVAPSDVNYIEVNLDSAEVGQTIFVEITPPIGQRLAENGVRATGVFEFRGNTAGSTLVAFDKTAEDTEISVTFESLPPIIYSVIVESSALPYVRVNLPMAEAGQNITLTITPPIGQRLSRNGVTASGVTSFTNNTAGSTEVTFQKTAGNTVISVRFETTPLTFLSSFIFDPIRAMLSALVIIISAFFAVYVVRTRKSLSKLATINILSTNDGVTSQGNPHGYSSIGSNNNSGMQTSPENGGNAIKPTPRITINSKTDYSPKITHRPFDFQGKMPNPRDDERRYLIFTKESLMELHNAIDWGMHTQRNRVEQGGVLLGRAYKYNNEIYNIVKSVILADTKGSPAFVEFSNKTWAQMQEELSRINDRLDPNEQIFITGWFHTHPNSLAVFMSGTDKNTQRLNFSQNWQASLVLNPHTKKCEAYFGERNMTGRVVDLANVRWSDLE
jgi:hypothetical protein